MSPTDPFGREVRESADQSDKAEDAQWQQLLRQLEESFKESTRRIAILGMSGSGKSAYMFVLSRLDGKELGGCRVEDFTWEYRRYVGAIMERLPEWHSTKLEEKRWLYLPLFSMVSGKGLRPLLKLQGMDVSGEVFRMAFNPAQSDAATPEQWKIIHCVRNYLKSCHAIILLLSADCSEGQQDAPRWEEYWLCIRAIKGSKLRGRKPFVIALTKSDKFLIQAAINPDSPEEDLKRLKKHLTMDDAKMSIAEQIRRASNLGTRLLKKNYPQFLPLLRGFGDLKVFPMSSWGFDPAIETQSDGTKSVSIDSADIRPWGIHLPLSWLSQRIIRKLEIKRKRRFWMSILFVICVFVFLDRYDQIQPILIQRGIDPERLFAWLLEFKARLDAYLQEMMMLFFT